MYTNKVKRYLVPSRKVECTTHSSTFIEGDGGGILLSSMSLAVVSF